MSALLLNLLLAAGPAPWHLPEWQCRAVVEVTAPAADSAVDTAVVKVLCQGRGREDGADYRVLDSAGQERPFQVLFHDSSRYSLIAFQAANPGAEHFVYFGNPEAERSADEVMQDAALGSGPPKGSWVPRAGVTYTTLARPEGDNPKTIEEMAALIAASPARLGARVQRKIADGYNPFGSSDDYISIYRGWLNVPEAGTYKFCTASNEASFSFLDGQPLIHWPGRHTAQRGERGEKNVTLEVSAGLHYVEYYHEEVTLQQMAFLGWSPPNTPLGGFLGIPEELFPSPHTAGVTAYESPAVPLAVFEPQIVSSIWPEGRHEGQYTRVKFRAESAAPLPSGMEFRWNFGDGLTGKGAEVEHVYLRLGRYQVQLSSDAQDSAVLAECPLEVYEIQHVTDEIAGGSSVEYAALARDYARESLDAQGLRELAHLLADGEDPTAALEIARGWIDRYGSSEPDLTPLVRRLIADCVLQQGEGQQLDEASLDEAIAAYQASLTEQTLPVERFDVLARLIRLLAIERGLPDRAAEVMTQVQESARDLKLDDDGKAAYRRAVIAGGDGLLWHGKLEAAREQYRQAELALGRPIPPQVRSARIGAYPNAIRELLATDDAGAALDLVREWEETFPTEKIHGQTFFFRGKLLALGGRHREAARHLARAVVLGRGAAFESEARLLLAQSLVELGRSDDAKKEFALLIASGLDDEFVEQARARLKELQAKE